MFGGRFETPFTRSAGQTDRQMHITALYRYLDYLLRNLNFSDFRLAMERMTAGIVQMKRTVQQLILDMRFVLVGVKTSTRVVLKLKVSNNY